MLVRTVKTARLLPSTKTINEVLNESIPSLNEGSVVVITSKIVALCEGRVAPFSGTDKEELVRQESDLYLPATLSKYGYHFTITQHSLVSVAGIDESNGGDHYVLWPADPQKSANEIRRHLKQKFGLNELGIIICDSTSMPMRQGTIGLPIAYSGFGPINNYIGQLDLFGRPFKVSRSGVALGLAATAVVVMGEGAEQTPIAIIEDIPFVKFQDSDPTKDELEQFYVSTKDDDLYAPFLNAVEWQEGNRSNS